MIEENYRIYFDRLEEGQQEKLSFEMPFNFLEDEKGELKFTAPLVVEGEVYLSGEYLVFHLNLHTEMVLPCIVCNGDAKVEISLLDIHHLEELTEHRSGVFEMEPFLRELVLLEVPAFAECNHGHCPQRQEMECYLEKENQKKIKAMGPEKKHHPFADL